MEDYTRLEDNTPCGYNPDTLNVSRTFNTYSHRRSDSNPHSSTNPSPNHAHDHPHQSLCRHHVPSLPPLHPYHFNTLSIVVLAILCTFVISTTLAQTQTCTNSAGCFPSVGNLALGRTVQVNSTCMNNELFCLLLASECATCSPNDMHSASSINDNDNSTFWVSEIGPNVREVALQLDFEAPVLFQDMTLVWQSIRPVAMMLERSCDHGETWAVYRYYALDCDVAFMMEDTFVGVGIEPFNGTAPICTSTQSELFSFGFTDAVITFSTSEHTPINEAEASCYQTITNLRVVMLDQFVEVRISNSSFQYYAVREWIVRGSCMCNGHASTCVPGPGEEVVDNADRVYTGCLCQHNTNPPNCAECLSDFSNAPYLPGTPQEANVCEACMCNDHARDCEYLESQSMSVCLNCSDNTAGDRCGECSLGYYQDPALLLNDPDICIACDCYAGGLADPDVTGCDNAGQCSCKANVASLRCNQCQDGYFNLSANNPSGCQMCDCNPSGSELNEQGIPRCNGTTGECVCLPTVEGESCDACQPGSYDVSSGCPSCDCNVGGSRSPLCDQDSPSGQCPCKPNIRGTLCTIPTPGWYFITLDSFAFEAEDAEIDESESELIQPVDQRFGAFTGRGFVSVPDDVSIDFTFSPPLDSQYEIILRFSSVTTATFTTSFTLSTRDAVNTSLSCTNTSPSMTDSLTASLTVPSVQLSQGYLTILSACLDSSALYQLSLNFTSSSNLLIDSVILLPDVARSSAFYSSSEPVMQQLIDSCLPRSAASDVVNRFECEDLSFTLATEFLGDDPLLACECDPDGTLAFNTSMCAAFGGGCGPCQPGVTGQQCDTCLNGFFDFSPTGCQACDCDPVGSLSPICSEFGVCSCKRGVGGPTCSDCLPNSFNFTSEGCTPCDCSEFSESSFCNVTTGECVCPDGVTGHMCDACMPSFFNLTSAGCQSCDCDEAGSASDMCDGMTGQCTCMGNLMGRRCDECGQGFFNTGQEMGEGQETCERCVCSGRSSICSLSSVESRVQAVFRNFSQLCPTDPTGCGEGWRILAEDRSIEVFFGPNDVNGLGYILSINMMPMVFVPEDFLGDRLSSYGLNFTVGVTIVSAALLNTDRILVRMVGSNSSTALIGYPYIETATNGLEDSVFLTFTISLVESNWRYEDRIEEGPDVLQFLSLLSNITEISFTADFTEDFIEFIYIREVSLLSAVPLSDPTPSSDSTSISLPMTRPTENCTCPAPYQGPSCEMCARGYARPSGNIADACVECECNGKTMDCDVQTAVCLNCTWNTVGDQCERCEDGYYGDPTRDIVCMPCACPNVSESNSFSPTCVLDPSDDLPTCTCPVGYTGRNCEICMDGFFGNPVMGRCTTCECNGNVDPALGPVCNISTGQCLNCTNNTTGFECELCQLGYFGDPGTNISCRVCDCDPRGLDSYCDPLFGTCRCLPNVEGEKCDMCRPGFFNITEGVGCTECSCDPTGSLGSDCDQDSGDCLCLDNVGSPQDNKCSMCTPGYFNLTAGIGCQACNCSALAVSESCDTVTGRCECQEGAIGLKCDDCAFGFSGQVPNCEPCHDCYFQWYNILTNFTTRAETVQSAINQLLTTIYNGHTEESLMAEIALLRAQLEQVNTTLCNVTLEESDVQELEQILYQLNASLVAFTRRTLDINEDLDDVELTIEMLGEFDGTVNMTDVMDLEQRLLQLNTTVAMLSLAANQSLARLVEDQDRIYVAWEQIEVLESEAQGILVNFTEGEATVGPIEASIDSANETYRMLRQNLTVLDMQANRLARQIDGLMIRADNVSMEANLLNDSFTSFSEEVERRNMEIMDLLALARVLNDSVLSLELAADEAETSASNLMEAARSTLNQANDTLQNITDTLSITADIAANLTQVLNVTELVRAIELPSLAYAQMLAQRIMENIVPAEQVAGIMEDARENKRLAEEALELARNASAAVMSALDLIVVIEDDITCTYATQIQVEELIIAVDDIISQVETDIDIACSLISDLEEVYSCAVTTYNATSDLISVASALGVSNRAATNQLLNRATIEADEARQYRNEVVAVQNELDSLTDAVGAAAANASATLMEAQELNSQAQMLESDATEISLEDIYTLLADYEEESRLMRNLEQRIAALTLELEGLIETFTTTQQRLEEECYRTP